MKLTFYSWNINGYQTCDYYGGFSEIISTNPEFICLQEVKISNPNNLMNLFTMSYENYYNFSERKGHNGVYIYSKNVAVNFYKTLGIEPFDKEGRFICLEFDKFFLLNIYMPHGGRDKRNLEYKIQAYYSLVKYLAFLKKENVIILGDFNVARSDLDVERYKQNREHIMFTEAEKNVFQKIFDMGYVDVFREKNLQSREYTWWPYAFDAREKNIGWRIDYCIMTRGLLKQVANICHCKNILGSDHCPICVDISI